MTAVVPDDFIRLKYRQPLHEPALDDKVENKSLSLSRKIKPKLEDHSAEAAAMRFKPPVMLPAHTQNTRVESIIYSDDVQYRRDHKPTLFERVEVTKQIMKKTLRDEKRRADMERRKLEESERLAKEAVQRQLAANANNDDDDDDADNQSDEAKSVAASEDGVDAANANNDGTGDFQQLSENELMQMDEEELFEYKKLQLEMKEKRVLRDRNSVPFHFEKSKWERRRIGWYTLLGFNRKSFGVCEILPWLELGGEKEVQNQMHMMMRQVTHILNVTPDLSNKFPQQFVYLRVAVNDSERDRIDIHFDSVLSFFSRVEQKRGKLIAHCDSGSCRAPAFIIAYLMTAKGISLADAYDYVCARRPTTSLNQGFLQQLAKLELSLGNGCSVLYHADWQFFEFNNMKSDIDPKTDWRKPSGVLETALALHRKENAHDDHF